MAFCLYFSLKKMYHKLFFLSVLDSLYIQGNIVDNFLIMPFLIVPDYRSIAKFCVKENKQDFGQESGQCWNLQLSFILYLIKRLSLMVHAGFEGIATIFYFVPNNSFLDRIFVWLNRILPRKEERSYRISGSFRDDLIFAIFLNAKYLIRRSYTPYYFLQKLFISPKKMTASN